VAPRPFSLARGRDSSPAGSGRRRNPAPDVQHKRGAVRERFGGCVSASLADLQQGSQPDCNFGIILLQVEFGVL
jgi:hypothetical protein